MQPITILGGGNTAFAAAANLALRGYPVHLCELPQFAQAVEPVRNGRLRLDGVAGSGTAHLRKVTLDVGEALVDAELVLVIVPAYAHRPFAQAAAPYLKSGHTVVLMPGTLGTLEWARILEDSGHSLQQSEITLAETDTAPYVCRKTSPDTAHIWGVVSGLGLGVLPASSTDRVAAILGPLFTTDGFNGSASAVRTYPNVLACGLSAMNPVVHPAGVLMNAGRVERSRGDFYFYEEGVTPAVCEVITAVDEERRSIGKALGFDLAPVDQAFHAAGFGPQGDLWAAINGSRMLTQLRAPGAINTRWLTEDVPYGLGAWASLGAQLGVATPTMDALVQLGLIVTHLQPGETGRGSEELGLARMDAGQMLAYAATGVRPEDTR